MNSLSAEEICAAQKRMRPVIPDIVDYVASTDAVFALITIKAFNGIDLSPADRRYALRRLGENHEPLAFRITRYLDSMDGPADICVLKDCDIAERLLTGGISDDHYEAIIGGRMGLGGGRGRRIDVNSTYRWHPTVSQYPLR